MGQGEKREKIRLETKLASPVSGTRGRSAKKAGSEKLRRLFPPFKKEAENKLPVDRIAVRVSERL